MKKSAILPVLVMTASMTACSANAIPESPTGADDYRQAAIGTWQIDGDTSESDEYPDALMRTAILFSSPSMKRSPKRIMISLPGFSPLIIRIPTFCG